MSLRIKPSIKTLAVLMVICAALLAVCVLIYVDRSSQLGRSQAKISDKETLLRNSQETIKKLTVVETEYTEDASALSILEKGVSTKEYVPTLLRQLEDMGKREHLRVVGVRPKPAEVTAVAPNATADPGAPKPVKRPDPYNKLIIEVEVNGKYWDVAHFIRDMTAFPKIIAVNEVQATPLAADNNLKKTGSPNLSAKINVTAFVIKEKTTTDSLPSRVGQISQRQDGVIIARSASN